MQVTLRQLTGDTIDYRPLLNYLITNIDVDEVNVEAYTHQNVKIKVFRIVDPDTQLVRKNLKIIQQKVYKENAFMYDSIQVAEALNNLYSIRVCLVFKSKLNLFNCFRAGWQGLDFLDTLGWFLGTTFKVFDGIM